VLTAYRLINEGRGDRPLQRTPMPRTGFAMRGLSFGGQTKIAFTQDSYLHALEVNRPRGWRTALDRALF